MSEDAAIPRSPLDGYLAALSEDLEKNAVRPVAEYLGRFPGDDEAIRRSYSDMVDRLPALDYPDPKARGAAPAVWSAVGTVIDRFRVTGELGRGGQGIVFLAEDTRLRRRVALKLLTGSLATSPETFARFRREAEATSRIDHPGICPVFDTGNHAGVPYLAMRYVDGRSLARLIAATHEQDPGGPPRALHLPEAPGDAAEARPSETERVMRVVGLIEEAARALHAAHQAGVIHRDVKPGNIMIERTGKPVVLDFGLARDLESEHPTVTRSGELLGTPAYMAPEQVSARRRSVDARSDVFSLGVTLFESLTLRRPFEHETREGLIQAILNDEVDARRLNPALSRDLGVVLQAALEKDPARRYQSAAEFADDLAHVLKDEPIEAKPPGLPEKARRWARRHPAAIAAGAVICALFVALPIFVPKRGILHVTSAPEEVHVEVTRAGGGAAVASLLVPTSGDIELAPGAYVVSASKRNHRKASRSICVETDRQTTIHVTLEPMAALPRFEVPARGCLHAKVADLDEDGRLDLVTVEDLAGMWKMEAVSGADKRKIWSTQGAGGIAALEFTTVDDDGVPDVAAVSGRETARVFVLSGRNGASLWSEDLPQQDWQDLATGDLDGDGTDEVVVASGSGEIQAWSPRRGELVWKPLVSLGPAGSQVFGLEIFDCGADTRLLVGNRWQEGKRGSRFLILDAPTGKVVWDWTHDVLAQRFGPLSHDGVWFGAADGRLGRVSERGVEMMGEPTGDPVVRIVGTGPEDDPGRSVAALFRSGLVASGSFGETLKARRILEPGRIVQAELADVCGGLGERSCAEASLVFPSALESGDGRDGARVEIVPLAGGPAETYYLAEGPVSALVAADFDNDGHSEMLVVTTRHTDSVRDSTSFILSCRPSDIVWRSPTAGSVFSSPVIADVSGDGRLDVVVASRDTRVYALSGDDGHPLWSQPTEGVIEGFLAVGDLDGDGVDEVVTGSNSGGVHAYRGGDGRVLWPPFRTGALVFARSALADFDGDGKNDVACASYDGFVYRLKGTDGRLIGAPLHVEGNTGFRSSPRLVDLDGDPVKDLVIGTLDGRLCGFSGTGGPPLWTVPIAVDGATELQREVRSSPNVADLDGDQVQDFVIGGADGIVYAVKGGKAPSVLWRFLTDNVRVNSSPAVADLDGDGVKDVVVGGQEDERDGRGCWVYAISGRKGTLHWKYRTGGGTWSSPLLRDVNADGVDDVLIGSSDRHLYVLSGRDGALLVRFALDGRVYSSPSMADVTGDGIPEVVLGSHDNHAYALSLSRERIDSRKRVPRLRRAREDLAAGAAEAVMAVPAEPTRGLRELHFASAKAFLQRGRHASAAVELRLAALGGLRSGELGALHLLCALSTAGRLDDGLVHACVLTDPIGFLLVLTTPTEFVDSVDEGLVRTALEPLLAQGFVPAHRNAALADGVLRLLLDRPRAAPQKAETDPVRADYLRTLRALAAILAGAEDVDLAGSRTVAGERFASCWAEDAPKIRERLRLPTAD